MKIQPLAVARYAIETTPGGGFRAVVPARRHALFLLFMCVWMVGWAFGATSALNELLHPRRPNADVTFLALWLVAWTLGGVWVVSCVLWQFFGREVISLEDGALVHRVEMWGVGRTRAYAANSVSRLRVVPFAFDIFRNQRAAMPPLFGAGFGPIAFDYGERTFHIAPSLDEAEAHSLVTALAARLPRTLTER